MIQSKKIHELNHNYLIISGDFAEKSDDFRYRMLLSNCIDGIIPMQIRVINGKRELYFDVTDKESLSDYYEIKQAEREDVQDLFRQILKVSTGIERFLIDEGNLIMRPEMIYRNLKDGSYEFICVPKDREEGENEPARDLLRFLMGKINTSDEVLTECVFGMYDMTSFGNVNFSTLYETLTGELRGVQISDVNAEKTVVRDPVVETVNEPLKEMHGDSVEPRSKFPVYIPSFKECGAVFMCLLGLFLIGTNIYMSILY